MALAEAMRLEQIIQRQNMEKEHQKEQNQKEKQYLQGEEAPKFT